MIITMDMYDNSMKLLRLHAVGKAMPIGPSRAGTLQWVATDTKQKVVEVGLILKEDVRFNKD